MKTRTLFSLTLFLALALAFTSCKKDDDDPTNGNTTAGTRTEAGPNVSFTCKLNGEPFQAAIVQALQSSPGGSLHNLTVLGEDADKYIVEFNIMNLTGSAVTAGTYDMETQSSSYNASIRYYLSGGTEVYQMANGLLPGEIRISTLSGTNAAGSFNTTLRNTNGDEIVVTEGAFTTNNYGVVE